MATRPQEYQKFISKQNQKIGKDRVHSLSPNIRPPSSKNNYVQNSNINLVPNNIYKNKNLVYNNNINNNQFQNYNIKVNKSKDIQKEKIIEGDLINFNNGIKTMQKHNNNNINSAIGNKTKLKNPRGMPRKSPIPINNTNLKNKNIFFNPLLNKPKTSLGTKNNFNGNKPLTSFSKNKKKINRNQSPLLRTNENSNKIIALNKNALKPRYISKSPVLGKNSIYNRYKNFGFNKSSNSSNLIKSQNFKKAKINYPHNQYNVNNLNNLNNNQLQQLKKITNIANANIPKQARRQTIMTYEFVQENNKNDNKNNIPLNNKQNAHDNNNNNNNNNKNIIPNNNFINGNNFVNNHQNINQNIMKNKNQNIMNQNNMNQNNMNQNNMNQNNMNQNIMNQNIMNQNNMNQNNMNQNLNQNVNQNINQNVNKNISQNLNQNNNILKPNIIPPEEVNNFIPLKNNPNQIIKNNQNQNGNNIKLNKKVTEDENESNTNRKEKESIIEVNTLKNRVQNEDDLNINKEPKIPQQNQPIHKKIKDLHVFTHVGFDGEQDKENNQDNYFIQKNFAGHKDYIYMSVCDGHGTNGHHVSNFIKTILPVDMSENLKHRNILTDTEEIHQIIKETFIIANDKLVENQDIDSIFSGSTCVSVIYTPERLICPNIGDSRAVLARYDPNSNKYIAIELTRDHKPTELDEKQRILENDGRIQPFVEDGEFVGPERIWIKEEEVPGLAMTRSFGDRVAATVGVISEPEIKEMELNINDKFMIIASDGIWEFISSQECVNIISNFYEKNDIKGCCEYLYDESSKRWLKEEEVIDDTTLILVFFD